jgi:amino acid adenylation domain-containing protein
VILKPQDKPRRDQATAATQTTTMGARDSQIQMSDAERTQVVVRWNDTRTEYPAELCLHQTFEAQADRTPHAIAAEYENQTLTYAELDRRANQLARYLRSLGTEAQGRVAVCLKRSLELPVALLAVLKAGAACVPLDPNYPEERLQLMLQDSVPSVLLSDEGSMAKFSSAKFSSSSQIFATPGPKIVDLKQEWAKVSQEDANRLACDVQPADIAYVIYTSGSTGRPKGVLITHGGLVNHGVAAVKLFGHGPSDRVLQFSSISFDIAIEEIFPTWLAGAAIVFRPEDLSLQATDFLRWAGERRITVLDLPTAYWHELVHELSELKEPIPPALRLVIVGGEKASAAAFSAWRKAVGNRVRWINTYGPTETSVIATAYEPPSSADAPIPAALPIGRPIANTTVYLLDEELNPVPVGVPGEIHIGGAGVARGYLNRPESTAEKFITDPFSDDPSARLYKTGDMAQFLPSGEIEFVGRRDFQVKIRGFRVEPGEIEAVLERHPAVRDVAVVAREGSEGDKRLVAYFVPRNGHAPASGELRAFLQGKLPAYMVPASFLVLKAMPFTPNGKVDRKALPDPSGPDFSNRSFSNNDSESFQKESGTGGAQPKDALELQLAGIWESVLGIRHIGMDQNFFDLGGHSILAVRLMHRIEQALQRKLPITTLLQAPTIGGLAELMRREGWSPSWSSLVPIQPRGSKLPFFCVHGIGGTVLRFRDLARYLGQDQVFYGLQAKGLDGRQPCAASVEEMAADYIRDIRQIQPQGPYFLGGYSFGGMVSLEMAQQLRAQGEEVALVALLDTFPGRPMSSTKLLAKLLRMPMKQKIAYSIGRVRRFATYVQRRLSRQLPPDLLAVRKACYLAESRYVPKVYSGRITVFRPNTKSLRSNDDAMGGWSDWSAGGVEIHEISGRHDNMFFEPNVAILAEKLTECLRRAEMEFSESLAVQDSLQAH